jgi:hypothetical protein
VTFTCPAGHASQSGDYCDLCGRKMTAPAVADPSASEPSAADTSGTTDQALSGWPDTLAPEVAAGGEPCPLCGSPRPGTDRYCEACGHDFVAEAAGASDPPASSTPAGDPIVPSRWEATVFADRAHYDRVGTKDTPFPMHCPERQFVIEDRQVRIGRRSASATRWSSDAHAWYSETPEPRVSRRPIPSRPHRP